MNLRTGRAWTIKELLRELWQCPDRAAAGFLFSRWYGWATRSRLALIIKVAKIVKCHLHNVLTTTRTKSPT